VASINSPIKAVLMVIIRGEVKNVIID